MGVEFYSLSKSYNLTGARISFVVGIKISSVSSACCGHRLTTASFILYSTRQSQRSQDLMIYRRQRQEYGRRNRALCGGLRRIGWNVPDSQGTMFVWAKIPEGYDSSADFCMKLMEKTGVIVTPGSAFGSGGEGYVRMALVVDENMINEIVHVLDESRIFRS